MHLFVLQLHPLISRLEAVCGDDLLVAYADDISVIVTLSKHIEAMRVLFDRLVVTAGAKLNVRKSVAVDVVLFEENAINTPWLQTANIAKILGVVFANSIRLMTSTNWDAMVAKFAQQMWLRY